MKPGQVLFENNPALLKENWLPEPELARWPQLRRLREEHVRLLGERVRTGREVSALRQRHEDEDKARAEALTTAYRDGSGEEDVPDVTPPEERAAELREAEARYKAAHEAFVAFLEEAVATVQEHADAWRDDLDKQAAEVERKRERAQQLLAEAEADEEEILRMRAWVTRTETGRRGHYPYAELPVPRPQPEPDWHSITGEVAHA